MSTKNNKGKYSFYLNPETVKLIKECQEEEGLKTQSMYVERAVKFYSGYIRSNKKNTYLPNVINDLFDSYFGEVEDKLCNMIFKIAVELGMLLHVYSALNNVTEENLDAVHDSVIKEVRSTYGFVSFKDILEFQNSQKKKI